MTVLPLLLLLFFSILDCTKQQTFGGSTFYEYDCHRSMWNKLITELYTSDCSAMRKFQSLDRQARVETNDTTLETIHQNAITCLCVYKGSKGWASSVSTSGLDGQLVIWDLQVVALVIVETPLMFITVLVLWTYASYLKYILYFHFIFCICPCVVIDLFHFSVTGKCNSRNEDCLSHQYIYNIIKITKLNLQPLGCVDTCCRTLDHAYQ